MLEDEQHFIDWARSSMWFAMELPRVNPTPETLVATETSPLICLVACFRHLPTLSLDDAHKHGHDIPYAGAELSRPYPTCMSAMSHHATRRNDEASDAR